VDAEEIFTAFLTSNIYIGLFLPKALTLAQLGSYEFFRKNKIFGLQGILSFALIRDAFPHWLPRGIPRKERVP
jgi:hypothetical protein